MKSSCQNRLEASVPASREQEKAIEQATSRHPVANREPEREKQIVVGPERARAENAEGLAKFD